MPQHIALPTGPGDHSTWDPFGAATIWEAWANELHSSWAQTTDSDQRARVLFEPLPAEAAAVSRVSIVLLAAGDDHALLRAVTRLAGVDDISAATVEPLNGGYSTYVASFDLAPGGLPWTVARRNALQAGVDCVLGSLDPGSPLNVDSVRLATDYEAADPDVPLDHFTGVEAPRARTPLEAAEADTALEAPRAATPLEAPPASTPVDIGPAESLLDAD